MDLEDERDALVRADRDIEDGKARIRRQQEIIRELSSSGHDTTSAVRLLGTLEDTLTAMNDHRLLIVARIEQMRNDL
ncbi:hypothetical protein AWB77_01867 [Caballeronia fortuita]|uniref:Uncharacterized protein n=1 Tax=Caballeronia fortuita TaxID=1777138 RepID=A0A158AKR3_9BURK|nr:hypothetical protein [Caballeronia fortuita]SAK58392.1 hypothetical protein AWB77_01867 [Caballeronia fortuita]